MKEKLFTYIQNTDIKNSPKDLNIFIYLDSLLCRLDYEKFEAKIEYVNAFYHNMRFKKEPYSVLFIEIEEYYQEIQDSVNNSESFSLFDNAKYNLLKMGFISADEFNIFIKRNEITISSLLKIHNIINHKIQEYLNEDNAESDFSYFQFKELKKRLEKQFNEEELVGDIRIDQEEFIILKNYFNDSIGRLRDIHCKTIIDIPFVMAFIILIGREYYRGGYWKNIETLLNVELSQPERESIFNSYKLTMISYSKPFISKLDPIDNVLIHNFIADNYLFFFFDLLYDFYNFDLLRDVTNCNDNIIKTFIEKVANFSEKKETRIKKHTSLAFRYFYDYCKNKVEYLLKEINEIFWTQKFQYQTNVYTNRLKNELYRWAFEKDKIQNDFISIPKRYVSSKNYKFSSPLIYCNLKDNTFELVLPEQNIGSSFDDYNACWGIEYNGYKLRLDTYIVETIVSYKTEAVRHNLELDYIFTEFKIYLYVDSVVIKEYTIDPSNKRIFDINGNELQDGFLLAEEIVVYGEDKYIFQSDSLVETIKLGSYTKKTFMFKEGDIVRYADNIIIIGESNLKEGLTNKNLVNDCFVQNINGDLPIYNCFPTILLLIKPDLIKNTAIRINTTSHRLSDLNYIQSKVSTNPEMLALEILVENSNFSNDLYAIEIDIPGERRIKKYNFVLIHKFNYCFCNSPYIYTNKGLIKFDGAYNFASESNNKILHIRDNYYEFEIQNNEFYLYLFLKLSTIIYKLLIKLPVFQWKDKIDTDYKIYQAKNIWKKQLPEYYFVKGPFSNLSLLVNNTNNNTPNRLVPQKSVDEFVFDLTKLQSWVNNLSDYSTLYLTNLDSKGKILYQIELMKVYSRSIIESTSLTIDYEDKCILCKIDIFGISDYYIDVIYNPTQTCIADKIKLINYQARIYSELNSGLYHIIVYENVRKNKFFSNINYEKIYEYSQRLTNLNNLLETKLNLINVQNITGYRLYKLKYKPQLIIKAKKGNKYLGLIKLYDVLNPFKVIIDHLNFEKQTLFLRFYSDGEYESFLHDWYENKIVENEISGLPWQIKYDRYTLLDEDYHEYVFVFSHED